MSSTAKEGRLATVDYILAALDSRIRHHRQPTFQEVRFAFLARGFNELFVLRQAKRNRTSQDNVTCCKSDCNVLYIFGPAHSVALTLRCFPGLFQELAHAPFTR